MEEMEEGERDNERMHDKMVIGEMIKVLEKVKGEIGHDGEGDVVPEQHKATEEDEGEEGEEGAVQGA